MKKIVLIVVLVLFYAEGKAQASFNPGIRAGASFAKLSQMDADFKPGFYVSGFGALKLGKVYTLQPEISYTEQGADNVNLYEYNYNTDSDVTYEYIKISYISVGITNKFNFRDDFNFHLGPIIDFQNGQNKFTDVEIDLSFIVGLEYVVANNLAVEFRAKKGLIDVIDSSYQYNSTNPEIGDYNSNFVLQLGLSYAFDFSK